MAQHNRLWRGALLLGAWCGLSMTSLVSAASADYPAPKEPLLMEGKSTLYQRVLTTPSCQLYADPKQPTNGKSLPAFSQFYVYADLSASHQLDFYQVGSNATGKVEGFLSKDCVVPWKQQLAMLFTNSAGRSRSLIYENSGEVDKLLNLENTADGFSKMYEKVITGEQVPGVISIEPENYIDYQQHFYLLPILNSEETMFMDGTYTYKHEIASIVSKEAKNSSSAQADKTAAKSGGKDGSEPSIVGFKSAIVFVIDSSISMQPYIDRTKEAINTIYKSIEAENLNDSVQFGIVSFRGDSKLRPGLDYTTKMYLKPGDANTAEDFNRAVEALEQAKVSSAQFNEDSYAGINMALQDINWNNYGGRYLVLITDAGAIDAQDKQSSTGLDAQALRLEAEHYGAAIYTLHLLTKSGAKNHKSAQAQYETLSFNSILNKALYYPVNAGSVSAFGAIVDALSESLTDQVKQASLGHLSAGSALAADDAKNKQAKPADQDKNTQANIDAVQEDSAKLGLAMQLAYLGRVQGTESPSFMTGWMTDRDMIDHNKLVCTPIVLVNRNQLSDLYTLVKGVLSSGIAGQLSSDDMFAQLQALAAQMGRDPNQLDKSKSLSEMGIMSELLDDLPYKSRIAALTPDDWYNLGSQEQDNIIRGLENSLNYLQHCSSDNDRWIKLNELSDESEQVYPIPLDALP